MTEADLAELIRDHVRRVVADLESRFVAAEARAIERLKEYERRMVRFERRIDGLYERMANNENQGK